MESREIKTMRHMEWERAKGSLKAILETYWSGDRAPDNYCEIDYIISEFIKTVEYQGLID